MLWILFFLLCAHAQKDGADFLEVDINQGRVRGYRAPGTDVYAFYGIPYATAPTGEDKFKAPLPAPNWTDTLEAVDNQIACQQDLIVLSFFNITMTDDCLIANVLVPDTDETNLPVLVLIHGGAFQGGYGNMLPTKNLVNSKKVITVNFNYRMGIPGFLCLGNEVAPGNAGMKDQIALLRWVRDNIAYFGGNPNDVTVGGCSSGGSSADALMLSKLSDGLIHKVLPGSGSSIGSWPVQFDPIQNAKDHALRLNFTNVDDIDALSDFYKTLSYDIMLQDSEILYQKDNTFLFTICVEKDIGQERFLEDAPINIFRNFQNKILPMFFGFASLDGVWRYSMFNQWSTAMNDKFSDFLPADLEFDDETQRLEVAEMLKEFYFGNLTVNNDTILSYIDYFSDVVFVQDVLQSAKMHVQSGNPQVYVYEYSFNRSDKPAVPGRADIVGAGHCAQSDAVLDEGDETVLPEDYRAMKEIMRELWLNFIIFGNPTPPNGNSTLPTWPPFQMYTLPYYSLGQTIDVANGIPVEDRTLLWDMLYREYPRTPIAPNANPSSEP